MALAFSLESSAYAAEDFVYD